MNKKSSITTEMNQVKEVITIERNILGCIPVFRGTRIAIKTLFNRSFEDFLADHPTVSREQAQFAIELACDLIVREAILYDESENTAAQDAGFDRETWDEINSEIEIVRKAQKNQPNVRVKYLRD